MAHFARLNDDSVVVDVIVIPDSACIDSKGKVTEAAGIKYCTRLLGPGKWVQTSYNGRIRGIYARIGGIYDKSLDQFFNEPKPFPSWIPDGTGNWRAPVPLPLTDGDYAWNEDKQRWDPEMIQFETEAVAGLLANMTPKWDEESQSYVIDLFGDAQSELTSTNNTSPIYEWDDETQSWVNAGTQKLN